MNMDLYTARRSIGQAIVFSIITCGIYMIYWLYQLLSSLYRLNNQPSSAGFDILLTFITCGIYGIYLMYKIGKLESGVNQNFDMPHKDDSVLYLILAIFSLQIIVYAIVQSNLNTLADNAGTGSGPDSGFGGGPGNYNNYN